VQEAIEAAKQAIPALKQIPGDILPGWVQNQHEAEMFMRMLF